jgi:hypothetical protein
MAKPTGAVNPTPPFPIKKMAKKKIRPIDPIELSEIMDESDALELTIGDDSAAYDVDEDEIEKLLADDDEMLIPVKRSIFETLDTDDDELEDEDMDEYPDEAEDDACDCGEPLLDDGLCRYCDHGDDNLD